MVYALISILLTMALLADLVIRGPSTEAASVHLVAVATLSLCAAFTAACYAWKGAGGEPEDYLESSALLPRLVLGALLGPYSLVAALVLVVEHRFSREAFADEVAPSLWVGRLPMPWERSQVSMRGVQAVLNLCLEFGDLPGLEASSLGYSRIPMLDSAPPSPERLERAVDWCLARLDAGEAVLVHCAHGHGRSALVAAATVLSMNDGTNPEEVVRHFETVRPGVRLSHGQRAVLEAFHSRRT